MVKGEGRTGFIVAAGLVAGLAASAGLGAFAESGHRVVGLIAEAHLQNTRALAEVKAILRPQESLADAACWPDTIKDPLYEDGDTAAFRLEHPAHDVYHYTNLPFQAARYEPAVPGARPGDIVQTARECVRVLRGASSVFTRREALRLLAHLIGDLHQPLHVGTGYIAADGPPRFVEPRDPTGWRVTLGGNALVYGPQDRFNLHSYWDAHAVNITIRGDDPPAFARRLLREVAVDAAWVGRGEAESWPEQWANEALAHAKTLHEGIRIAAYVGPDDAMRTAHRWRIEQPPGYDDLARSLVPRQLARGGYRLAAILKAIWTDSTKSSR